jgi:hypothetical protein
MTADDLIAALALPVGSRIAQRIPKKMLAENGAPTAADKRQITDNIEELTWSAVLKPDTVGVPAYRDETREYLELSVVSVTLRPKASPTRIMELIHRAIPYPVILVASQESSLSLSLAHKRWSQNEAGKTVLDGEALCANLTGTPSESEFLAALALSAQPRNDLKALYQGWLDTVIALHAADITGTFIKSTTPQHAETRRVALQECQRLETEINRLSAVATREKQSPRQVDANLDIQRLKHSFNLLKASLHKGHVS